MPGILSQTAVKPGGIVCSHCGNLIGLCMHAECGV